MGVIPNPKMAFIFPISCILALIFPILIKYFHKCEEKGSFLRSHIKSMIMMNICYSMYHLYCDFLIDLFLYKLFIIVTYICIIYEGLMED